MSIWNRHLCNWFGSDKPSPGKKGYFQCPLCREWVAAAELRLHAAKDDERFKDGLIIARIKQDHPEWVETDGACPKCIEYYQQAVAKERIQPREYGDRAVGLPKWAK